MPTTCNTGTMKSMDNEDQLLENPKNTEALMTCTFTRAECYTPFT